MYQQVSFWHKVSNKSLSLPQKTVNLIMTTWTEVLLIVVAINVIIAANSFSAEYSDTLSSYLLYVFTLGFTSSIMIFIPDIQAYRNRSRLHPKDTADFPTVQVIGAAVFIPVFVFMITNYFADTTLQLYAVGIAVAQLAIQRAMSYVGTLLQMLTAITTMLLVMTGTTIVLLVPQNLEYSLSIGILIFSVVGIFAKVYIWYVTSFLNPGDIKNSVLNSVIISLFALNLISLVFYLM